MGQNVITMVQITIFFQNNQNLIQSVSLPKGHKRWTLLQIYLEGLGLIRTVGPCADCDNALSLSRTGNESTVRSRGQLSRPPCL